MGRFSPVVRPEPFDLGGILDKIIQGYEGGRQVSRGRKREAREDTLFRQSQSDRRDAKTDQRAEQLMRPGARTLADFLGDQSSYDPQAETAADGGPVTEESLRGIADAGNENAGLDFKRPSPTPVVTRNGPMAMLRGGIRMPVPQMREEQAPIATSAGVVMDPARARQQNSLAKELERHEELQNLRDQLELKKEINPPGWEPKTADERLNYQEELARRTGILGQRQRSNPTGGRNPQMPLGITAIQKQIDDTQQDINTRVRFAHPPDPFMADSLEIEFYKTQLEAIDHLQDRLDSLTSKRDSMVTTIQQGALGAPGHLPITPANPTAPGQGAGRAPAGAAPAPAPAAGPAVQPDLVMRARALRAAHPDWSKEQVAQEMRQQDEQQQGGRTQ